MNFILYFLVTLFKIYFITCPANGTLPQTPGDIKKPLWIECSQSQRRISEMCCLCAIKNIVIWVRIIYEHAGQRHTLNCYLLTL